MNRRKAMIRTSGVLASLGLGAPFTSTAAAFPSKTLRLVVPFPPGGGTDVVARAVAENVARQLNQNLIVENKSGGFGAIAQRELMSSPADGHTLLMDSMAIVVFPHLMKKPLYNPVTSLDAVARVGSFPFVIIVNPKVPVHNVSDLVKYLRTEGKANVASAGATTRLAAELFRMESDCPMTFISYRGGAPTMVAMISGESHVYFGDVPTVINHIRSGRVRAIAVTSKNRLPILPDVPAVAESGFPSYEFTSWNGIYARSGTPPEILELLNRELLRAVKEPKVSDLLSTMGSTPGAGSVKEFDAFHKSQYAYWGDVVRRSNMPSID